MPKASYPVTNFTGGECSPRLRFRVDTAKYRNGLAACQNAIVMPHGGVRKRGGTRYSFEVRNSAQGQELVPFEFNTEQAYMLEFGPQYIRFFKDQAVIVSGAPKTITGITKANPGVVTTSGAHGYTNGMQVVISGVVGMTEVNGRRFTAANVTSTTFELSGVDTIGYTTRISGGVVDTPVEVTTTYAANEISDLQFTQSNDTLYIFHSAHPPRKLTRNSHTAWVLDEVAIENGPFRTINGDDTHTMSVTGSVTAYGTIAEGSSVTLVSSTAFFEPEHVGALMRLWEPGKATGIGNAPTSNTTVAPGDQITNDGKVYGIASGTAWVAGMRPPTHEEGTVVNTHVSGVSLSLKYLHDTSCILRITAYNSSTSVDATVVKNDVPQSVRGSSTSVWEEGAWSSVRGYPGTGTFHDRRLWTGGSPADPQTLWASRIEAFADFRSGADDDQSIVASIGGNTVEQIEWLYPADELIAGTASSLRVIKPSGNGSGLTPSNVDVNGRVRYGTAPFSPVAVGDILLFGQRRGLSTNPATKIRAVSYSFETDSYPATDQTIVSEHITKPGVVDITYQADPDSLVWCVRSDGVLSCQTYEREQEVAGWHRHVFEGTAAAVKNARVIPGADGDELWLIVSRTINGQTRKYIEVMTQGLTDDIDATDAIYLDSALTYDGAPTSTVSGLWHLVGETVDCLVDGAKQMGKTVSPTGTIALDPAGSIVHVGKRITSVVETLDLEAGAASGTAKGAIKRISKLFIEFYRSLGGRMGTPDRMDDIEYRLPSHVFGQAPPLKTGIIEFDFPSGHDREAVVRFEHDEPYPFTLLGMTVPINTQG